MSDRLPPRRRSGGGRHVATAPAAVSPRSRQAGAHRAPQDHRPRARRPLGPRVAQGGVVVALAVALGVVLVNPATGEGAATATSATSAADSAQAAQQAAKATRDRVAEVADAVTARAVAVRAEGVDAQVPADQLAQLDALRSQVAELVTKVQAEDVATRTDRGDVASRGGAERNPDPEPSPTSSTTSPAATSSPTADPTSTAAAAGPSPVASVPAPAPTGATPTDPAGPTTPAPSASASAPADPAAASSDTVAPTSDAPAPTGSATPTAAPSPAPSGSATAVATPDQVAAAIPQVLPTEDPDAAQLRDAVIALARTAAAVSAAADANRVAAQAAADAATQQAAAAAQAAAAQAAAAAQEAAQRAAWKTSLQGYANGRIPASALCAPTFDPGALLRCDAAEALDSLDAAYFQAFGVHVTINDSYRSYASQVACLQTRGWLCAPPGTSHHGLGIAVDLGGGIQDVGSAQHAWMVKNAATFQFVHPSWAQPDGSKPEPWHWEYTG